MKVVVASRVALDPVLSVLKAAPDVELVVCQELLEIIPHLRDSDVVVMSDPKGSEGPPITAALRDPSCKVRWIQVTTAGADGLLLHGMPGNIPMTNQGGAVAPTVAEHAMAAVLGMARAIPEIQARSARHEWNKDFTPMLLNLEGRTLAIVGYGNLGRQLARRARGFDMKIVGLSRSLTSDEFADEVQPLSQMHEVLGRADVVVVCVASSRATRHIMDAKAFAAMKQGSLFVNVSRGETVDQVALRQALVDGRLRGAFIDVTEPEPLPKGDPLWGTPNLIISPHVAGQGGTRTGGRIAKVLTENLERFRKGQPLVHRMEVEA